MNWLLVVQPQSLFPKQQNDSLVVATGHLKLNVNQMFSCVIVQDVLNTDHSYTLFQMIIHDLIFFYFIVVALCSFSVFAH